MKVCIDIQSAIAQRAGVGRYTKMLVEHLGPLKAQDELDLFYFDFKRKGQPFDLSYASAKACTWIPGRIVQKVWKTIDYPPFNAFAGDADLYHFPNFIRPPLTKGKSIVTIHDVSFLRYPETMEPKNYAYMSRKIKQTVEKADAIITDCEFVGDEIRDLLNVSPDKIFPICLGLKEQLEAPDRVAVREGRERLGLDKPYLLHVGTIEPRKNHVFLVEVFEKLSSFDGELIIAGMKGWKTEAIFKRIEDSPFRDRIRYIDYISDEDLPVLYAGAEAFVFPSLYEGFGFPPLEAMACGTLAVTSSAGSLKEVMGHGALVLDHFDAEEWAQEIDDILTNTARREAQTRAGVEHVRKFSWEKCAALTWDVYRAVAR